MHVMSKSDKFVAEGFIRYTIMQVGDKVII